VVSATIAVKTFLNVVPESITMVNELSIAMGAGNLKKMYDCSITKFLEMY